MKRIIYCVFCVLFWPLVWLGCAVSGSAIGQKLGERSCQPCQGPVCPVPDNTLVPSEDQSDPEVSPPCPSELDQEQSEQTYDEVDKASLRV